MSFSYIAARIANPKGRERHQSPDVEWAHAVAPGAHILLVEASSSSYANLLAAEDYASAHAQYVSNSWGGSESSGESSYDGHFATSGVSYFASAGDTGGVVEYPSASPNVVSVGGTTLHDSGSGWTETGWSRSGGGCSADEHANSAQLTGLVNCNGMRGTPDVASDADPNSGVDVYDTTSYYGQSGWFTVGGTSTASPVWAARSADRGVIVNASYIYDDSNFSSFPILNIYFRDITSGSNGFAAGLGYDLVTGLGSWINGDGTSTSSGPGAPTGLTATSSGNSIALSWTAPTGTTTVSSYDIYRGSSSDGEGTAPIATGVTATTYADASLGAGTYYYQVTAVDSSGVQGLASNEAYATVSSSTAPAAITGTSCSGTTCTFTGTGAPTLAWSFAGASPASATGSTVSTTYPPGSGSYSVTLIAGDKSTANTTVTCSVSGNPRHPKTACS